MKPSFAVCHWSAGAPCSLALYLALKQSQILCLLNLVSPFEEIKQSLPTIPVMVLRKYADALKIPLLTFTASPQNKLEDLRQIINAVKNKYFIDKVYFNQFDDDPSFNEMKLLYEQLDTPLISKLSSKKIDALCSTFIELNFKAKIIAINEKKLSREYLGAELTKDLMQEFTRKNINPLGCNGEFFTLCTDSPLYQEPIVPKFGEVAFKNGHWVLEPLL